MKGQGIEPSQGFIVFTGLTIVLFVLALHGSFEALVALSIVLALIMLSYAEVSLVLPLLASARVERRAGVNAVEGLPLRVETMVRGIPANIASRVVVHEERFTRSFNDAVVWLASDSPYTYTVRLGFGMNVSRTVRLEYTACCSIFRAIAVHESVIAVPVKPAILHTIVKPMDVLGYGGVSKTPYGPPSLELYAIRDWQPGDDARRIAWRLSLRHGRLLVREDYSEAEPRLHIVLDLSREMWSGRVGSTPADAVARAAASIATALARVGGVLGYTIHDGVITKTVVPGKAHTILKSLLSDIAAIGPDTSLPPSSSFSRELRRLVGLLYRSKTPLVLIISSSSCSLIPDELKPLQPVIVIANQGDDCIKELEMRGFHVWSGLGVVELVKLLEKKVQLYQ